MYFFRTSIKSVAGLVLAGTLSMLGGCGGGGATDPFASTPAPAAVSVNPATVTLYAGVPATVTLTSGVGPFQVFSSNPTVLPVTQLVSGAAITLVANPIDTEQTVTLTVLDAYYGNSRAATVAVTVKPSPLLSTLTVTPRASSPCGSSSTGSTGSAAATGPASVCSGDTATATVTLKGANLAALPNRQVRFDVVQGPYSFAVDQAATVFAKTLTAVTDQNGQALVSLRTDVVPSQVALIRATDVTSGNRVDTSFTILEQTNGTAVLSVVPATYTVKGFYTGECPASAGDYVLYGGVPPYTVVSGLPNAVTLTSNSISGQSITVGRSGGVFTASNGSSAGCGGYTAPLTITDSAGRTITAQYVVQPGTTDRPTPPAPDALVLTPTSVTRTAVAGFCAPGVLYFTISGGSSPYRVGASVAGFTATLGTDGTTLTLQWTSATVFPTGTSVNAIVLDSLGKVATAAVTCS
ncbi:MAG: hypothetical protein JNL19_07590 [Burkholderiales bacterium]|nr:hypothetical protein [Burkholderiales bacterium]